MIGTAHLSVVVPENEVRGSRSPFHEARQLQRRPAVHVHDWPLQYLGRGYWQRRKGIRSGVSSTCQLTNNAEADDEVLFLLPRNLADVLIRVRPIREPDLQTPVLGVVQVYDSESLVRREAELSDGEDVQITFPNPRDLA